MQALSANYCSRASLLARAYNVSAKTIREIWIGRTWYWATCSLHTKPFSPAKLLLGRPKGSKHNKPRIRKLSDEPGMCHVSDSSNKRSRSCSHIGCLGCKKPSGAWQEWLLGSTPESEFTDPFHDEQAFWPRSENRNLENSASSLLRDLIHC